MPPTDHDNQPNELGLNDIWYMLFKHKHLILTTSAIGVLASLLVWILLPAPFESQSKLLVRYILDRNIVDPQETQVKAPDATYNDNIITAEKEILSSWDLASQVVDSLNEGHLVKKTPSNKCDLTRNFLKGLTVSGTKGSNVITVSYKNPDPRVAQLALEDLINRYFVRHLEVHRSAHAFDYVADETAKVQARLQQIEEDLKTAKEKAGIVTLKDTTDYLSAQIAKSQENLNLAEETVVAQRARVKELERLLGSSDTEQKKDIVGFAPNKKEIRNYQLLAMGISSLRQKELDLLSRFTSENSLVKSNRQQIDSLEAKQRDLEKRFPGLIASIPDNSSRIALLDRNPQMDLIAEQANLAAMEEKTGVLRAQLQSLKDKASVFEEMIPQISMLQRKKELEEANFKYFHESLDKARIDEALDPSKIPNISIVQRPTPASPSPGARNKYLLGLSFGGFFIGISWAVLIELFVDKTLKRPVELARLKIPKLLTIPDYPEHPALPRNLTELEDDNFHPSDGPLALAFPSKPSLRPYAEALRDRLILNFQLKGLNDRPKFIALAGFSNSTEAADVAASLAMAFAEAEEGKILFVNLKMDGETQNLLFQTNCVCSLNEIMARTYKPSAFLDNLVLTTASSPGYNSIPLTSKRLYEIILALRSSEFAYVIFDLPVIAPTSNALAYAGMMDKVLLLVESEVSIKSQIKWAYQELLAARADVSAVFIKYRVYGPKWISLDI